MSSSETKRTSILSYTEAKRLHIQLWTWLANHPEKRKDHWPFWQDVQAIYGEIENKCFACHVAKGEVALRGLASPLNQWSFEYMCPLCPVIEWRDRRIRGSLEMKGKGSCLHRDSEFRKWTDIYRHAGTGELLNGEEYLSRRELAKDIKNMVWPRTWEEYHNME